jgi:hypothetical protein
MRRIFGALVALTAVGAMLLPLATSANAASAAPAVSCNVTGSGSPGIFNYLAHINANPCKRGARGAAECVESIPSGDPYDPPYVYTIWSYGPEVHSAHTTSEVGCSIFVVIWLSWGYQQYYGGKWHYHQIGSR